MRQQFLMPKILTRSSQSTLFGCSFTLASPRKQNTLFHSLKVEIRGFCPRKQLGVNTNSEQQKLDHLMWAVKIRIESSGRVNTLTGCSPANAQKSPSALVSQRMQ
jgi:hypothetical protein